MNQIDTPRTNAAINASGGQWSFALLDCSRELERELTEAIKQRDRLAEALRKFVGDALFCSHADTATTVLPHRQTDDSGDALTMP
jgi:hypothetical protein